MIDVTTLEEYDTSILPTLVLPLTQNRGVGKNYLGGQTLRDDLTLTVNFWTTDKAKLQLLYEFFERNNNFILNYNLFGLSEADKFIVSFASDLNISRSKGTLFEGSMSLNVKYAIDSNNELKEI